MSLVFSNSVSKSGIIELIDASVGSNSTSYPLLDKTRDVNLALDKALSIIFDADGTWQFDDSNHTDYPIITTDLVANQRDYTFTSDENGNLILEIYKVMIKDEDGYYFDIYPVDMQSQPEVALYDGRDTAGTPYIYDKTANGFFLEPIPEYSATDGIKVFINREASYFTSSDTTKKPGFAGIFHEYLALRPAYQYAYRNSLPQTGTLQNEMLRIEQEIRDYYSRRSRDERDIISQHITEYH